MARARITIEAIQRSSSSRSPVADLSAATLTDSSGQFTFSSLPGGTYLLSSQKRGYATTRFGQKQWNAPGSPIVIDENGQFAAELQMKRLGAISGRISDENGLGLPNLSVYAYRSGPRLRLAQAGMSDDRGVYRIAGLGPGRYYVRTAPLELEGRHGLLPTFFGQAMKPQEARTVEVRLDEEVSDVDLEPVPGRLASLQGTLSGDGPGVVTLYGDAAKREARVEPGAAFVFDELTPGSYELVAESVAGGSPQVGHQKVFVGRERETVNLQMAPPPKLRVRCDETTGKALDSRQIAVFVRRGEDASEANPRRIACGEAVALAPGRWEIAAAAPPSSYVASISNAEQGSEGYELTIVPRRDQQVVIGFGSNPALVKGKVSTADGTPAIGAPVFLYALEEETRRRGGGLRSARSGQDGTFRLPGIPPGRYEVLSSFQVSDEAANDWPLGRGVSVTLEEGSEKSLNLELVELGR